MITKAEVLSGFAAKLPAFGKSYEFGPGLNVLFGPNGCGKTTMVGILGAYSGTQAGWSRFLDPPFGEAKDTRFPKRFKQISPGKCEANVHWDGTANFLMSPETGTPFGGA
jgi:predicted AAA+ superfamily ATPase